VNKAINKPVFYQKKIMMGKNHNAVTVTEMFIWFIVKRKELLQ